MLETKSLKVLYVEDEVLLRRAISLIFEKEDKIDFHVAYNNSEAIDLMQQHYFDVIIFDWWLEKEDGTIETCMRCLDYATQHNKNSIKIVFTSDDICNIDKKVRDIMPVMSKRNLDELRTQILDLIKAKVSLLETVKKFKGNGP